MKLPLSDRLKKCADKYTYFEGKELMLEAAAALAQQAHDICENSRACIRCQAVIEPNMAICFACHTQQAQPRCAMCDKPIPVGCKDCTEYALDAVGAPQQAQPNV